MKLNETPIEKDFRVADVREEEKIPAVWKPLGSWKEPESGC